MTRRTSNSWMKSSTSCRSSNRQMTRRRKPCDCHVSQFPSFHPWRYVRFDRVLNRSGIGTTWRLPSQAIASSTLSALRSPSYIIFCALAILVSLHVTRFTDNCSLASNVIATTYHGRLFHFSPPCPIQLLCAHAHCAGPRSSVNVVVGGGVTGGEKIASTS